MRKYNKKNLLHAALFGHTIAVQSVNDQIMFIVFLKCIDLCPFTDLERPLSEEPLMRFFALSYNYDLLIFGKHSFEFCSF